MTIKRYKVDYNDRADIVVEIDHSIMTEAGLKDINDFWTNSESRLAENAGSVLNAVLKMLASTVFYIQLTDRYGSVEDIIESFDWGIHGNEGWPEMDGSSGIKLISCEDFYLEHDCMTVEEVNK